VKSIVVLLLLSMIALIVSSAIFAFPNKPDIDPTKPQGMVHYVREGQYVNGTKTWTITEIDPAFFSHLSNYTIIIFEVDGRVTDGNVGSVYINDNFVGTANNSQDFNEWNVPVGFCDVTTVIKVVSEGWAVKSINLEFYVEFSNFPPWWKQNVLIIFLALLAEITVVAIITRRVVKWIRPRKTGCFYTFVPC
jgi:hypothetical protein